MPQRLFDDYETLIQQDLDAELDLRVSSEAYLVVPEQPLDFLADLDFIEDPSELSTMANPRLFPNGRGYVDWPVKVTNQHGQPMPGVQVGFDVEAVRPSSSGWRNVNSVAARYGSAARRLRAKVSNGEIRLIGSVSPNRATTDSNGVARTRYTVSHIAGNQGSIAQERVNARISSGSVAITVDIGYDDLTSLPVVSGGLRIVNATGRHIHQNLVSFLRSLGEAIKDAGWPHPATVTAGTLRWGGLYPPHFTHMRGASMDFRPMSSNGQPTWCRTDGSHASNYDRSRTQALIRVFKQSGATKIFFNDPQTTQFGARPLAGHDNHIHVSWLQSVAVSVKQVDLGEEAMQTLGSYSSKEQGD